MSTCMYLCAGHRVLWSQSYKQYEPNLGPLREQQELLLQHLLSSTSVHILYIAGDIAAVRL